MILTTLNNIFINHQNMRLTRLIGEMYQFRDDSSLLKSEESKLLLSILNKTKRHTKGVLDSGKLIVTGHCLPTLVEMFSAIKQLACEKIFFPVPYSIEEASLKKIESLGVKVVKTNSLENHLLELEMFFEPNEKAAFIVECGGYLPQIWHKLSIEKRKLILGAVEDTERGLRNYEIIQGELPVIDVARSTCKSFEDAIVGDSVVASTEFVLRKIDVPLVGLKVCVLGFGKIGQSAARALNGRRAHTMVFDINPHMLQYAFNLGYEVGSRESLLNKADLIVGCSGESSLKQEDIHHLKNRVILSSGSSRCVEFGNLLESAINSFDFSKELSQYFYEVPNNFKKQIYAINRGYPANFLHGSSMGNRIDLVISSLVSAILYLEHNDLESRIQFLPTLIQRQLSDSWNKIWDFGSNLDLPNAEFL